MAANAGPSPADQELIAHAAQHDLVVTARQLEVWRQRELLERNITRSLGHGRGSVSRPPDGAKDMVVWLARHAHRGGRPQDLALRAFGDGLPVPEPTVRAAFRSAIDRMVLQPERAASADEHDDPHAQTAAIAEVAAAARSLATMLPVRIRRIDERLAKTGWSVPPAAIAQYDKGSSSAEPMKAPDMMVMAITTIRHGGDGLSTQELGDLARALAPAGTVSPLASMIEHSACEPGGSVLDIEGVVPRGDVRDHVREIATSTPLELLRAAWLATIEMRTWAEDLCAAVEGELDAGCPGEATLAWLLAASFVARAFLVTALRHRRNTPTDHAQTALGLLFTRAMLHELRAQMPSGSWELLENPAILPEFFRPVLGF